MILRFRAHIIEFFFSLANLEILRASCFISCKANFQLPCISIFVVWIADVQILSFGMPMFNFVVWNVDVQFQYHLTVSLTTHIVCLCVGSSVCYFH